MKAEGPRFPRLFSPLRLGPAEIPNRIVSSGHDTVMVHDGQITDQLVAYHQARAEGGTGLIVVQVAGVHESARYTSHVLMAADDSCLPGYARLAGNVHAHGTVLFGQLFHPGREVMESADGSAPVAVAPSAVPSERFRVMPRALRRREITEIVAGYGAAAGRLIQAGLDGVEIVASHGYLPSQFLNPHVNQRDDEYGGSPDARLRFLLEVAEAVRSQAGPVAAAGIRISVDEHDPAGLPEDIALHACAALASAGLIDYVSVTVGTSATLAGSGHIVPEMGWRAGYTARLPGRAEFGGAVTNLQRELTRAGVKVVLHSQVTPGLVASEAPDLVVVATGARPYRPPLDVKGYPVLADAWEVIQGRELPSGHVVVVDWRGDWTGIGTARLLAERGHKVTLAVTGYAAGERLQQYVRDAGLAALQKARITVVPLVRPYGADDDTLYLQHVLTSEPVVISGISATVLACGHQASSALLTGLEEQGIPAVGAGDCLAPRTVEEAVLDGLTIASEA